MQPFLRDTVYFLDVFVIKKEETKYVWGNHSISQPLNETLRCQ